MLLSDLPPEILYLIATHLPAANALVSLAQTCRRLHEVIAAEDWRIFRAFIRTRFANVPTPQFWKDAAQALTSRSRALDRHAVIGRFVLRPMTALYLGKTAPAIRRDNPTHNFRPVIDSYEIWNGSTWHERQEVLAWAAEHEVVLQIRQSGPKTQEKWFIFNDLEHVNTQDDIRSLHLLRPEHRAKTPDQEHLLLARTRGELVHLAFAPMTNSYECKQKYETLGLGIERTEMGDGPEPIMAVHLNNGTIAFYNTATDQEVVGAFANIRLNAANQTRRNMCSKFLSSDRFAVATGRYEDAIAISTISQERISLEREMCAEFFDNDAPRVSNSVKAKVTAITPLNGQTVGGFSGDAFLAAWGDEGIRLHDLRSHKLCEQTYRDTADANPAYCILPFGQDRFIVGAGGDAVVKFFDLRMLRTYNHRDARSSLWLPKSNGSSTPTYISQHDAPYPSRDFSIFLSFPPPPKDTFKDVFFRPPRCFTARERYRGPIYAMSSPSILSPTVYAGVAGGIVRLDVSSTDDLTGPCQKWYRDAIDIDLDYTKANAYINDAMDLSGYERPESMYSRTCSKLRTQKPFWEVEDEDITNENLTGWDRRWKPLEEPGAWRRRR